MAVIALVVLEGENVSVKLKKKRGYKFSSFLTVFEGAWVLAHSLYVGQC